MRKLVRSIMPGVVAVILAAFGVGCLPVPPPSPGMVRLDEPPPARAGAVDPVGGPRAVFVDAPGSGSGRPDVQVAVLPGWGGFVDVQWTLLLPTRRYRAVRGPGARLYVVDLPGGH